MTKPITLEYAQQKTQANLEDQKLKRTQTLDQIIEDINNLILSSREYHIIYNPKAIYWNNGGFTHQYISEYWNIDIKKEILSQFKAFKIKKRIIIKKGKKWFQRYEDRKHEGYIISWN